MVLPITIYLLTPLLLFITIGMYWKSVIGRVLDASNGTGLHSHWNLDRTNALCPTESVQRDYPVARTYRTPGKVLPRGEAAGILRIEPGYGRYHP